MNGQGVTHDVAKRMSLTHTTLNLVVGTVTQQVSCIQTTDVGSCFAHL